MGDEGGAGFATLVPMLQASKTKIETIQIAPLKILIDSFLIALLVLTKNNEEIIAGDG